MRFNAVLWKEWIVFRRKWLSITMSAVVGPLLYLIAFGWGLGNTVSVGEVSYTSFVIPGIIAMNSMSTSFGVIANDINISRIYGKTFEAIMMSPIQMRTFTVARVTGGALRGLYTATIILLVSFLFHRDITIDAYFVIVLVLNCFVFSAIGFIAGILINSHADMAKVTSFVITPMSFLCGTLFPLDRFPKVLAIAFESLPLTQTVKALRSGVSDPSYLMSPMILAIYLIVFMLLAIRICRRAE
ncbi:MAG: ABC transporter permease [Oscillospiraceae bacterium]|nr:ABC transporter permease [Oscillospiraceae bacterium]